ncbi:MAG: restriction endonuclease subunit S [Thermocrinis sp.]|jgi:restriction endonuclease S subunit|uniref:restriction endonuclease subunit S n=1 Tax=Thermocrinis sp. TaxID=2024383 RepID=UPI003C01A0F0
MAVFNVIKLSELEGAKRLDAEYYKSEYLELLSRLRKVGCVRVKDVAFPIRRKFKPKKGEYFDYIEISEVDLTTGEFNTSKIIGEEAPDRAQWVVNKDDILISTVRPIRNAVAIIKEERKNLVCSSGFCVLHSKNIQANYLFLYLKIPFIAKLLNRYTTATEYPAVNWNDVLNTPIYMGSKEFQMKISIIIDKSFALLKQSRYLYSQAETLLLEELGLKDLKPKYEKTYTAKLSDVFSVHRVDAEYFQPAYEEVIEKLRENNIELQPLRKFILSIQRGIEPGSENYRDEGKPFIRVSNLSKYGFTNRDQKYLSEELYQQLREIYEPKQGDFLLTKDATPGIAYVVKEQIEGIISSGILRLQINDSEINKEYLALCINSIVGKIQVERDCGGSVILHWKPEQVKRLQIPILPLETQQEIASLVQQSHEARKKAKELLEIAKRAVEIAIENREAEALDYISKHA